MTGASVFDKLPTVIMWLVGIGVIVALYNYWTFVKHYLQRSWSIEKTIILKSRGSALNDHVANYVNCNNIRRLWPEITLDLLTSFFMSERGMPVVREIGLMGGTLLVRDFSPIGGAAPTSSRLMVVAFVEPSPYVTLRELFVCKICHKLANLTFFSIYVQSNNGRQSSLSVQQIRSAVVYLTTKYPKCYFTAIACGRQADSLLNYLGDTGAACRFESATLLAPACKFGQRKRSSAVGGGTSTVIVDRFKKPPPADRKYSSGGVNVVSTTKRLRKISLQEVASINFDNFFIDLTSSNGGCDLPVTTAAAAMSDSRLATPKNSMGNVLSAFLPDNVDDVAIPVLWVPEQRDDGCIAPVELFEESINFMLLRLGSVKRCRLDLWQTAVQFGLAVHSFFHSDIAASDKGGGGGGVRRK